MTADPPPSLIDYLGRNRRTEGHAPWPRLTLSPDTKAAFIQRLAAAPWTLLGEWADRDLVHAAFHDPGCGAAAVLSVATVDGRYDSLAPVRPGAIRLERMIAELSGPVAVGLPDPRPWLDHGVWPVSRPLGDAAPHLPGVLPAPYRFLPAEGESLHQIPVGPVHAGIIEPGHFRFTCFGETVVRLEDRLGYTHKGVEALMAGAGPERAAKLAGRISGDSTVACALAFSRAVEAATATEIPERAIWLRALMAELERIANHIGDIGAICNDVAFSLMHAWCGVLREHVARAAAACFGHRLMMDRVVPGGVAGDLDAEGITRVQSLVAGFRARFEQLAALYDETPSLQARMLGAGRIAPELVQAWGAGGFVGRAAGRAFDARRSPGYPPYDRLEFTVPVLSEGDVNARVTIRLLEIRQSLRLIGQILRELPPGPIRVPLEKCPNAREGMALVEGFRGDILAWLRLESGGTVGRCHLRDPSWFQWPLLTVAIEGAPVADFPLCNKSFNCSYSGHDL
ncbi:MAG: nickel-dependent hydrogenase large subunit [Rhodospirillaceae bacterium]